MTEHAAEELGEPDAVYALGAGRAGVAQLSVPLIAAAGGLTLIGEVPGPGFWVAAALVLGGVGLALK